MNKLPIEKRVQIIHMLVEGNSMRATARIAKVSFNTVMKLLLEVGRAAENFHNEKVRGLQSKRLQLDEIWSFVYAKPKNLPKQMEGIGGDIWTWTAIDADSKLIVSWLVGDRTHHSAKEFVADVKERLSGQRVQISTDGLPAYKEAIDQVFVGMVDFAQIVKQYGTDPNTPYSKYGTSDCIGTEKTVVRGNPNPKHIATSYVERQNLTMRMHMRRFTRATNGFSKKVENHWLAIALHFVYYNFVKVHTTIRVTPAMEAGLMKKPMTFEELVGLAGEKNSN